MSCGGLSRDPTGIDGWERVRVFLGYSPPPPPGWAGRTPFSTWAFWFEQKENEGSPSMSIGQDW